MSLRDEFERLWPMLAQAVAVYGPTHAKADVLRAIEAGDAQLWPADDAAFVTEIKVWPSGLTEAVAWLAAGNLETLRRMTPAIEAWARDQGCHRAAVTAGRPGWGRVLGSYRRAGVFLTKDL